MRKLSKNSLLFFVLVISTLILFSGVFLEFYATSPYLVALGSLLLVIIIFSIFLFGENPLLNPLFMFSIMYSGYALGAFYYGFSGGEFGKFIGFLNLSRNETEFLMGESLIYSILCYIVFVFGFSLFYKKNLLANNQQRSVTNYFFVVIRYYKYLCFSLLLIGLLYWIWVSYKVAGGIIQMLLYFQAFGHLVKDADISILPYHLYYAGIYLWLIAAVLKYRKVSVYFIIFSIVGLIIALSTGRITLAFTYIMAQMIFFYYYFPEKRRRLLFYIFGGFSFSFVVYFLRILSNQYFLGGTLDLSDTSLMGTIIGGGNVADLQQLVIIFKTFDSTNLLLGSSYLDTFRDTIGVHFGLEPHSVGLLIKQLYVPNASGAPTPGAIGEAYANFLYLGPCVMFLVGASFSYIYSKVCASSSPIVIMVYAIFLSRFVFIYPKVDSTMMINFLWGAMPLLLAWFLLRIFSSAVRG